MAPSKRKSRGISAAGKLGMAFVVVTVAFGLCEAGLRLVAPSPPEPGREPQVLFRADPEVGFLHVPNQVGWLDDGMATINTLGLRGEAPETPKSNDTVRVLAIGDSTTFGWGVGDNGTYCIELERLLHHEFKDRRIEVVNGGVTGYDLRHDAKLLRRFAPLLKPDIVLVGLYWGHVLFDGASPDGVPITAVQQAAAESRSDVPFAMGIRPVGWEQVVRSSRVLFTLRQAWFGVRPPASGPGNTAEPEMALLEGRESPTVDQVWTEVKAGLTRIRDVGLADGLAMGVVIMPIRAQVEQLYLHTQYQMRVRNIAESLGLFVVDPLPLFIEQPDHTNLFIPYDRVHFSATGNAAVADATFQAIRKRPEFQPPHVP